MSNEKPFFKKLKQGLCRPRDIEDYIDEWHMRYKGDKKLTEFLGMTWEEFLIYADNNYSALNRFYGIDKGGKRVASKK